MATRVRFVAGTPGRGGVALGLIALLSTFAAHANPGLDWLATQQAADGSYGQTPASLATVPQSTSEVLRAQLMIGQSATTGFVRALAALNSHTETDTELLARRIAVNAQLGLSAPVPVSLLQSQLSTHQHRSGGFGAAPGGAPSVFDTALALEALSLAAAPGAPQVQGAVGYLLASQQANGAWKEGANEPSVYLTALTLRALGPYRSVYSGVGSALTRAQNFLLSRQGTDGLWGEDFRSATVLLALVPLVPDVSLVDASAQALRARQQPNGSWMEDPLTTALALQALGAHAARQAGTAPEAGGSLSGYVVRAGSTEPIPGATVTVDQVPGVAVLSSGEGYYVLPALPPGSYTVTAQKAGYTSASIVVATQAKQVTLAPQLVLDVVSHTGLVSGLVFDTGTRQPLPAVQVSLVGATSLSVLTSGAGDFDFGPVTPGTYTLRFEKLGYLTMSGTVTVEAGRTLSAQLGLTRSGGYVDETPGTVSGRVVNGKTGEPLAGAFLALGGGLGDTSAADGTFSIASVPRGTYQGTLSAVGYRSASFSFVFAPGAGGEVGTLSLYPETPTTPPTTLTLRGLVADGVSGAPIPGATVALTESGASATAGADGRFVLGGLTLKSFHLALSAAGYAPATYAMQVAAFGEVDVTLKLSPPGNGASSTQLAGRVTDAVSGAPVAGAQVAVAGTALTTTTGSDGLYSLSGITALDFVLHVSAVGFSEQQLGLKLASHGSYTANAALAPVAADSFQVVSVTARQPSYDANATARFSARVASLLGADKDVVILGEVQDGTGASVATVRAHAEGTSTPASQFSFNAGEVKELTIPWDVAQFEPGLYRLVVRVSEPGTITRAMPFGTVLAEGSGRVSVLPGLAIDGALAINPPLTQAGLPTRVDFAALVRNAGNTPLPAIPYVLTVRSDKTGETLFTAEAGGTALPVGNSASISFGNWTPTESGNLAVSVRARDSAIAGTLTGSLYVGDKATGTFTVSRIVVPEGNQTVRGTISMQGVDTTVGTGTDPQFALVKEAVRRGGVYTATEGVAWNQRNACLGCHIQTQSVLGLSSAHQKAEIDTKATRHLFNAINTSLYPDGSSGGGSNTDTALALWSLSAWTDATQSFRTQYRSAQYLQARKGALSGGRTSWTPSHASGWWNTSIAQTALVVKGYVDVLRNASKLPEGGVPDYALGPLLPLGTTGTSEGMATGPDGDLYVVRTGGSITRLNPTTGQTSIVASGLGSIRGLAVTSSGTMYVTRNGGASSIIKIAADGTRANLPMSGNFPNATVGPDGWVYLPDWSGNRVMRVSQSDQVEVYVSGGLLNRPHGLAFDTGGNLLVANSGTRELLGVEAGSRAVSRFADGLAYAPTTLQRAADGSVYVTTTSPRGLLRVRPDGTAERVVQTNSVLGGLAVSGDRLFVVDSSAAAVREVEVLVQDTSGLAALRDELPAAARFLLADRSSDTDNVVHAMRLIGLAEARQVVTDETLGGQMDTRVAETAALLRSRQRADGGWPRYSTYSRTDPLATAMVGIALEYTHPSPQDPQIRNAIQYLLNSQRADGSWDNFNNGLSTRLASTSFVMVFMPKALDRLGGIDIDLYVETPEDIQLANASVAATSTSGADGAVTHLWKLPGVTGAGREVQFDLQLRGMQLGEQRPAARRAYLEFKNSFVDERVQVPLDVPVVRTTSGATLAVATDAAAYLPDHPVAIPATVTNTSQAPSSGQVALTIRAVGGNAPLATLAPLPFSNLAAGAHLTLPGAWNTGSTLAGSYEVEALLLDTAGRVLDRAVAPFHIQVPSPVASTSVTTDRPVYEAWDAVAITGRVRNVAPNARLAPSLVELTVWAPDGTPVSSTVQALTELVPGAMVDVPFGLALADAAGGTYRVTLLLQDAFTRAPLATSETTFQVVRRLDVSLAGTVSVELPEVYVGDANVCTAVAWSAAASIAPGVTLTHRVLNVDTGEVLEVATETVDFPAWTSHTMVRSVATEGFTPGGYACVLEAALDGTRRTLGFAGFRVLEPPIKLTATLSHGSRGRLLVLLEDPNSSHGTMEPFGPAGAPDLTAQRAFLETLLTRAGWSYTLTETAGDFTREFRSGGYVAYALFSEREKLPVQVQKELREAVYRGEGLLVAGTHDSRNHGNHETLGIAFIGHLSPMDRVMLGSPDFPLLNGEVALLEGEKPVRFELAGAEALGHYRTGEGAGRVALALHTYGEGAAAFSGPDLLAIGTRDGQHSLAATLLSTLLDRVHPERLSTAAGAVVPLQLEVANQGIAVAVMAGLPLPAGVSLVDAGQGRLDGTMLRFAFPLAQGETRTLRFWVRLPSSPGPFAFAADVTASQGGSSKSVSASLLVEVTAREDLAGIVSRLDALLGASQLDAAVLRKAAPHLRNALRRTTPAKAVSDVLLAADRLDEASSPEAAQLRISIGHWLWWALQQSP